MAENCNLCLSNRIPNTFCTSCCALFCDECVTIHINLYECNHNIMNYEIYLQLNESKLINQKNTMKNISSFLKEKLLEANLEVDAQYEEIILLINSKKEMLYEMIDKFYDEKKNYCEEEVKSSKIMLESMMIEPIISELATNLTTADIYNMIYCERIAPKISSDLENCIKKELNFNLEIYPTGKQVALYSFKPNSSIVYQFDILSEEVVKMNVKNFECKNFAAWCLANGNIIYTGGWKEGYSSYEVFEISTLKWTIELRPNLIIPRHQHSIIYLNNIIYVFGGANQKGLLKQCEKWIFSSSEWTKISSLSNARVQMGICAVNSQIYLSHDSGIERYDPECDLFSPLPIIFETKLLSVLVPYEESIIIFRGGEVNQLELSPSPMLYKITDIENVDLWSTTHPIMRSEKIYFFIDSFRLIYCFDFINKILDVIADLNHPDEAIFT